MRRLVAALVLFAATPLAAQPAPSSQPDPALLAPSDDARAFFAGVQSRPLTDELMATAFPTTSPIATWIDTMIEHMMSQGELVPSWQNMGVDEVALVAALPGGPTANMTEGANQFGPLLGYFVDRPIESLIPPQWVLIGRRGVRSLEGPVEIAIGHASPKVILVERTTSRLRGNGGCRERAESLLYADPAVSASIADELTVISTMRFLEAVESRGLCSIVEEVSPGQYQARHFDADGHSFPEMDRQSPRFRIVPVRPASGSSGVR
jgi:hypothetical protein